MDVFLSWSGQKSQKSAEIVKKWLPCIIQTVDTFYSSDDIEKGSRGLSVIAANLAKCQIGIIFITLENINAPWLNYESGALSKTLDESRICTFLINMSVKDIPNTSPLAQFQATSPTKEDFLKLLITINKNLDKPLKDAVLETTFNSFWPQIEGELNDLSKIPDTLKPKSKTRSTEPMVDSASISEILEILRVDYKRMLKDLDIKVEKIHNICIDTNLSYHPKSLIMRNTIAHQGYSISVAAIFQKTQGLGGINQIDKLAEEVSKALCNIGKVSIKLLPNDSKRLYEIGNISPREDETSNIVFYITIDSIMPISIQDIEAIFKREQIENFIDIFEI